MVQSLNLWVFLEGKHDIKSNVLVCTGDDKTKGEKRVIANWGDTLWSLADEHHVSADDIRRSNNLPPVLDSIVLLGFVFLLFMVHHFSGLSQL